METRGLLQFNAKNNVVKLLKTKDPLSAEVIVAVKILESNYPSFKLVNEDSDDSD